MCSRSASSPTRYSTEFLAWAYAHSQTTDARDGRSCKQNGPDGVGADDKRGGLQSSDRNGINRSVRGRRNVGRSIGRYGATVDETGLEKPGFPIVQQARSHDLDPIRELPYGPRQMTVAKKAGQMSAHDYAQRQNERFFLHLPGRPQMIAPSMRSKRRSHPIAKDCWNVLQSIFVNVVRIGNR